MPITQIRSLQIKNSDINKDDIDISTPGKSLITKLNVRGGNYNNIIITSNSGIDIGTGDVEIDINSTLRFYNYVTSSIEILNLINTNNLLNNIDLNSEQQISFKFKVINDSNFIKSSISSIRNSNNLTKLLFYNNTDNGYKISSIIDENSNIITSGSLISKTGSLILFNNNNFSASIKVNSNLTSNINLFLPTENSIILTELSDNKNINLTNIGGYFADGIDDYLFLSHSNELNFGIDDFSIEIAFSTYNNNFNRFLIGKGSGYNNSADLGFALFISSSNKLAFMLRNSSNTADIIHTSSLIIETSSIYNVVVNKTHEKINIYINGILDSYYTFPEGTIINVNNNKNLNVFAFNNETNIINYNYGQLLLLRLYNYALSEQEINTLYNNFKIGNYKLNDLNPYTDNNYIYNATFSNNLGEFVINNNISSLNGYSYYNDKSNVLEITTPENNLEVERSIIINNYENLKYETFKKYRIKFKYFISSTNQFTNQICIFNGATPEEELKFDRYNFDSWTDINKIQIFKYPEKRLKINLLSNNQLFYNSNISEKVYISDLSIMPIGCLLEYLPENAGANGWFNSSNFNFHLQTSGSIYSILGYKDVKTNISNSEIVLKNTWKKDYILSKIIIINPTEYDNNYYIGTSNSLYDLYDGFEINANSIEILDLNLFSSETKNLFVKAKYSYINLILLYKKIN